MFGFGDKYIYTVYVAEQTTSGITPFRKYQGRLVSNKESPLKQYLEIKGLTSSIPAPTGNEFLFPNVLAYIKNGNVYIPITLKNIQVKEELAPLKEFLDRHKDEDLKIIASNEQAILNPLEISKLSTVLNYQFTDYDFDSAIASVRSLAGKIKDIVLRTSSTKIDWMKYVVPGVILILAAISMLIVMQVKVPPISIKPFNITVQLVNGTHVIGIARTTSLPANSVQPGNSGIISSVSNILTGK